MLAAIAAGAFAVRAARGAPTGVRRLGVLWHGTPDFHGADHKELVSALAALGHVQGRNLHVEVRFVTSEGGRQRFAEEIVAARVDAIFTHGTLATRDLQQVTKTIPIVTGVADPVRSGFAKSVSRPGGNITGMSWNDNEISGKRFQLLKQLAARVDRVAIVGSLDDLRPALESAARETGLQLEFVYPRSLEELERFLKGFAATGRSAILVGVEPPGLYPRIAGAALRHGAASAGLEREFVAAGGLMSLRMDASGFPTRCAAIIDRIFCGADPAEIPFELPTRTNFALNRKTAAALGLVIPGDVLLRADEVFD